MVLLLPTAAALAFDRLSISDRDRLSRQLSEQGAAVMSSLLECVIAALPSDVLRTIYIYFIAYVGILIGSVVLVSLDNFDFETTFSAVLTTLGNVGPGMAQVGPMGNFAEF